MPAVTGVNRAAGPRIDEWLSTFWGYPIAAVDYDTLGRWVQPRTRARMVSVAIPADRTTGHRLAEDNGWHLVDVRVTLEARVWKPLAVKDSIRTATPQMGDALAAIARESFVAMTRFYNDPAFPNDRCDDLYAEWVRQSMRGYADATLAVGLGDEPAGFVTVHGGDAARIGLIAVARSARRLGYGHDLLTAARGWAYDHGLLALTVRTQAANVASLRVYEGAGFKVVGCDYVYHRWLR